MAGRTRWLWRYEPTSRSARRLLSRPWTRATCGCQPCAAAWSNGSLDWAPARILRPSGHLWRLGAVSHSQGTGRPTGRPATASGGSSHRRLQTSPLTTQVQLLEEGPRRTVHERTRGERGAADVRPVRRDGAPSCRAHVAPSDRHALVRRTSRGPRTSLTPKPNPDPNPNPRGLRNGNFTDAAVFSSFTNDLWVAAAPN